MIGNLGQKWTSRKKLEKWKSILRNWQELKKSVCMTALRVLGQKGNPIQSLFGFCFYFISKLGIAWLLPCKIKSMRYVIIRVTTFLKLQFISFQSFYEIDSPDTVAVLGSICPKICKIWIFDFENFFWPKL